MINSPQSNDTEISSILLDVHSGRTQLPEFQRDWTWDDDRIRGIIASLSQGYPMGAIMRLQYGEDSIRFKHRTFEGVEINATLPEYLVLDWQQRITSIYCATSSKKPVKTKSEKNKNKVLKRFYYISIDKSLDPFEDRIDSIASVPDDRIIKKNFDREIELDLSTREKEFEKSMFPLNIIFDSNEREDWADGYKEFYGNSIEIKEKYKEFRRLVLDTITRYKLPVITMNKSTPREAVCKVFENVNRGGVPLTVFELVTATFASKEFDLRKDWEECEKKIRGKDRHLKTDLMHAIDETAYLTTVTLYTNYLKSLQGTNPTSCRKKDVLNLELQDYLDNKINVLNGFELAMDFLYKQYVFRKRDLPYTTQLIPLAAIAAFLGDSKFKKPTTQSILSDWYWCGVLGEMYGGANETRYANDIEDVVAVVEGKESLNRTINLASFSSTRLLTLQTRLSAAYKGIMALVYREHCKDFMDGTTMSIIKSMESPDIHHIFPESYCKKKNYKTEKWNSIINKTPLLPESNRSIGGNAPSAYLRAIIRNAEIEEKILRVRVESHLIDYELLSQDMFDDYFTDRAKKLLSVIEKAMGKVVSDKDSEQVIKVFGTSLL